MVVAAIGLVASATVHVAALFGVPSPFGEGTWILHFGIFVVGLPAVRVLQPLAREFEQNDLWRAALRGCPEWMRRMTSAIFGYAVLNFFVFCHLCEWAESQR
jgi:hypothetical protein